MNKIFLLFYLIFASLSYSQETKTFTYQKDSLSFESKKIIMLYYQSQGLDTKPLPVFEKKMILNNEVLKVFYNLGADFETYYDKKENRFSLKRFSPDKVLEFSHDCYVVDGEIVIFEYIPHLKATSLLKSKSYLYYDKRKKRP